ncbi:unnamed protein product, partial [Nesidiocoris tenuis]
MCGRQKGRQCGNNSEQLKNSNYVLGRRNDLGPKYPMAQLPFWPYEQGINHYHALQRMVNK